MIDFAFDDNLDLRVSENEYSTDNLGETALLLCLHTNSRLGDKYGYWLEVLSSNLWSLSQSVVSLNKSQEIYLNLKESLEKLIDKEIFADIKLNVSEITQGFSIGIKCFSTEGEPVLERIITI